MAVPNLQKELSKESELRAKRLAGEDTEEEIEPASAAGKLVASLELVSVDATSVRVKVVVSGRKGCQACASA